MSKPKSSTNKQVNKSYQELYDPNKLSFKQFKEEEKIKEIYTPEELKLLLKKPNVKKCSFAEFRNWVIMNFLLGTGVRARELRNIKVKDIDLDNDLIALQVTKNRKARYSDTSDFRQGA